MKDTKILVHTDEMAAMHTETPFTAEGARKYLEHSVWYSLDTQKEELIDYSVSFTSYIHPTNGLTLCSMLVMRVKKN